jgi:Excalibur calcium-binding domain
MTSTPPPDPPPPPPPRSWDFPPPPPPPPPPPESSDFPPPPPVDEGTGATGSPFARMARTYRGWPLWAKIAAPTSAAIIVLAVVGSIADSPEDTEIREPTVTSAQASTTERPATTSTTTTSTTTTTTAPTTTAPTTTAPPATAPPPTIAPPPPSVSYANCTEARAAGVTPIYRGEPGYSSQLDRDGDGVACE